MINIDILCQAAFAQEDGYGENDARYRSFRDGFYAAYALLDQVGSLILPGIADEEYNGQPELDYFYKYLEELQERLVVGSEPVELPLYTFGTKSPARIE